MKKYGKIQHLTTKEGVLHWAITDMPPHVIIKFKSVFPKIKTTARPPFIMMDTLENCADLDWFMMRYPLEISEKDRELLTKKTEDFATFRDENFRLVTGAYEAPTQIGFKEPYELSHFQGIAVHLFHRVKRLLVADEVGLGKTVEALGGLMKPETLPALVVCQANLPDQWEDEIKKFTSLSSHTIKPKKPYGLIRRDVMIVKYTNVADWLDVLMEYGFKTIILDEIQEVRHITSNKHDACKKLADTMEYVMGLSGTPIVNYGDETYNIYRVINPELFPCRDTFGREWLSDERRVEDPEALGSYLQEQCAYIRRTKEEVGYQLKEPNKIVHTVGYDSEAMEKMEDRAKILAHSVLQGSFVERGQASRELSIMIRKNTGVSKARYIAEYVKMILKSGEKVLLGLWHREVYEIVKEELKEYNPVLYSGSETLSKKNKSKKAFIDGDSQVMLISLRSGVGLDGLQHVCKYVVIGELDWTGAMHDQLIGRLHRRGQTEQVTAIFLVSDSGSDPVVMDIIGVKKSQQDGIMNPFGKKVANKSDDTIIKQLAHKYAS